MKKMPPDSVKRSVLLKMTPEKSAKFITRWRYIGEAVDAFFNDTINPIDTYNLDSDLKEIINFRASYYFRMAIVIFEAEKFLKEEALKSGLNYPFKKRSELLKTLAWEECHFDLLCLTAPFQESASGANQKALKNNDRAFYNDEISEEKHKKTMRKLLQEWSHLTGCLDELSKVCPWTNFCDKVIIKHRKQIPSFSFWAEWHTTPRDCYKYAFQEGSILRYPGRGKSTKKKKASLLNPENFLTKP